MQDRHNMYAIMKQCALPVITTMDFGNQSAWAHDVWFNEHHIPKCMS